MFLKLDQDKIIVKTENHPWQHRLNQDDLTKEDFVGNWMHPWDEIDLSKPAMSITNGWGARHMENKWYADELHPRMSVYAYDCRGQGASIKQGELDAVQGAIDLNFLTTLAFDEFDRRANDEGVIPGNKIIQGNCVGTMAVSALFAGGFPLVDRADGVVLISPVSTFNLPTVGKAAYFLPVWMGNWLKRYWAGDLAKLMVSGEESEESRQRALERLDRMDIAAAIRQARQIFWKENVEKYWPYVDVPVLFLVSRNDPLTTLEESAEVFDLINKGKGAPVWIELEATDHLLLEDNMDFLRELIPDFAQDPWKVYDEYGHVMPDV